MKSLAVLVISYFFVLNSYANYRTVRRGYISDLSDDLKFCSLIIEEVNSKITCDDKIQILELKDTKERSRGTRVAFYTNALSLKGFEFKSCTATPYNRTTNGSGSSADVIYCFFQK